MGRVPVQSLVDEDRFRYVLAIEFQKAIRLGYCISVVCLGCDDPLAVGGLRRPGGVERVFRRVRATDTLTLLPDACVGLLLIDAAAASLPAIVQRVLSDFDGMVGDRPRRPAWSAGASCYPDHAENPDQIVRDSMRLLRAARARGGNRLHLASSSFPIVSLALGD